MKDALGNVLTIPEQTYKDVYKFNPAYKLLVPEQQVKETKKVAPVAQKTKKTEGVDNGTVQENTRPERID